MFGKASGLIVYLFINFFIDINKRKQKWERPIASTMYTISRDIVYWMYTISRDFV